MTITINGEKREFPGLNQFTVVELLDILDLGPQPVLVELNGIALYAREFSDALVHDKNQVEIILMVAGG